MYDMTFREEQDPDTLWTFHSYDTQTYVLLYSMVISVHIVWLYDSCIAVMTFGCPNRDSVFGERNRERERGETQRKREGTQREGEGDTEREKGRGDREREGRERERERDHGLSLKSLG